MSMPERIIVLSTLALLIGAALPKSHATSFEGDYPPLSRVSGKVAIRSTSEVEQMDGQQGRSLAKRKLGKIWEERTHPVVNKLILLALGKQLVTPATVSRKVRNFRWFEMQLSVVIPTSEVAAFKRELRRGSRITAFQSSFGKIRWKSVIHLTVAPEPSPLASSGN